jgi:hypothetical protein
MKTRWCTPSTTTAPTEVTGRVLLESASAGVAAPAAGAVVPTRR